MRVPAMMGVGISGMRCFLFWSYNAEDAVPRMLLLIRGPYFTPCRGSRLCAAPQERCTASGTRKRLFSSRQIGHLALRQPELKGVQRHRDHRVIAAQPDDLNQPAFAEHLHGLIVEALGNAVALVQRFGDVVDHLSLRVVETGCAAMPDVFDDLGVHAAL